MKRWKPIALCAVVLCISRYALAQDRGFDVPINSGTPLPIPTYTPPAPKSRADAMTAEQIAAAIEAVRVQKAALDQWEMELRSAALSKRVAKWGVIVDPPAPPTYPQTLWFHCGLFGGE
jgi:hypothetical protein